MGILRRNLLRSRKLKQPLEKGVSPDPDIQYFRKIKFHRYVIAFAVLCGPGIVFGKVESHE